MSIKRILEVSSAAHLSCQQQQLKIKIQDQDTKSVPIEDIGFLILDNLQITHTQYLLAECLACNVAIITCDSKHMPTGMLMPLQGHTLQSRIMQKQACVPQEIKQEVWRQIISAKITAQQRTLEMCARGHPALSRLAQNVLPGDPNNCEAQAARIYFPALFGEKFQRDQDADGLNAFLNYGYAILRSACARALSGAGLHLTLGIHHKNQYNPMCLADDHMEPLRPMVDAHVHQYIQTNGSVELDRQARTHLVGWLATNCTVGKRNNVPLMVALEEYCASLRAALFDEIKHIKIPKQLSES